MSNEQDQRTTRVDFGGRIRRDKRTPQGGARITANVTRVGVFEYRRQDGSIRRELRHPDDVFHADSLGTLEDAPVTIGHPGKVTPANYQTHAVGHARDARRDGRFVAAQLVLSRADALEDADSGKLDEVSMGYDVVLVDESGTYEGEKYDARQTQIRYNHVALGPRGWGRAGSEVRMRLDGASMTLVEDADESAARPRGMSDENKDLKTRLDAAVADLTSVRKERDDAKKTIAELEQKLSKVETERADFKAKAEKAQQTADGEQGRLDAAAEERVAILEGAALITGKRFDGKGKKNREIMVAAVTSADADFKADGRSDDYVRSRFDGAVESAIKAGKSLADVNRASGGAGGTDRDDAADGQLGEDFSLEDVRADFDDRRLNQWMNPDPRHGLVQGPEN